MTTTVVRPNAVDSGGGTWTKSSGTSEVTILSDANDSTYLWVLDATYCFKSVYFPAFSPPAGNVVKSIQLFYRTNKYYQSDSFNFWHQTYNGVQDPAVQFTPLSGNVTRSNGVLVGQYDTSLISGMLQSYDIAFTDAWIDVVHVPPPTTSAVTVSAVTATRQPTVGWTFAQGADGSGGQTWFQVMMFSAAQYGIGGFDPNSSPNSYNSGGINSASASHVLSAPLKNGVTYKAYVRTWQTTSGVNQPSAWVAGTAFTVAIPVPVPTAVTPAAASTVTSSRPALAATVGAMAGGSQMYRQWQLATNVGFTLNVVTVAIAGESFSTISVPVAFPALPTRLKQGVWYIRCRAIDQDGVAGAYTAAQSFTVAHPGSTTTRTPTAGATIQYTATPTLNWSFSDIDTDDFQTKYQVQLWKTSTPGTVLDSGLVTSTNKFHQFVAGIDATWKNTELRWKVQAYDQDAVTAGYSVENTFYFRDLPVVTITAPAPAAVITTASPLVTWTNVLSGGATQTQWKVDIVRASVIQETSGWVSGTALLYQVQTPVVTVGPTHQVVVTVVDSNGLTGSDTHNFTATYAATTIPVFTIDGTQYQDQGLNIIDWTTAQPDANFFSWEVLRRNVGDSTWTTLFTTQTVGTRTYRDFLAPAQQPVEYVVVQTDISIGAVMVESVYIPQQTTGFTTRYMLVCPSLESLNLILYQVKADSFQDELEIATLNLIGRGRRVEYGSRFGNSGSLTSSLRDVQGGPTARQQRIQIDILRNSERILFLRNPFGDVFQVTLTTVTFDRVGGVGMLEYIDASIQYMEVTS